MKIETLRREVEFSKEETKAFEIVLDTLTELMESMSEKSILSLPFGGYLTKDELQDIRNQMDDFVGDTFLITEEEE